MSTLHEKIPCPCPPEFLFAGKARFRVSKGTESYDFRVTGRGQVFDLHYAPEGCVSRFIGTVHPDGLIRLFVRSAYTHESKIYRVANWTCQAIAKMWDIPDTITITTSSCGRCGERFKTREDVLWFHQQCMPQSLFKHLLPIDMVKYTVPIESAPYYEV